MPLTGFGGVLPSVTVTDSAVANSNPTAALCGAKGEATVVTGVHVFDILKSAVDWVDSAEATTRYVPGVPFAVKGLLKIGVAGGVGVVSVELGATPFASVVAVVGLVPFEKVPPAPDNGAVKVTTTPATGVPGTPAAEAVVTMTLNGTVVENAVLSVVFHA